LFAIFIQQLSRHLVGVVHDLTDFCIYLFSNCFRIITLLRDLTAKEDHFLFLTVNARSHFAAHAEAGHHAAGKAVKISVNQTYPLRDAARAHSDLESRKTTGSTVLLP
jgi:NADPH:quinone reductase-like Zn-dependent oxidoreductase